jgi:tetratricopeptide (TPR) repeat protein
MSNRVNPGPRNRLRRILIAAVLLASARFAAADWAAYESKSFTIYSDRPEEEVAQSLRNFELFKYVALQLLALPDVPTSERLKIIMFANLADYQVFAPEPGTGGYFSDSVFGLRMVIGPRQLLAPGEQVLFHEYVHYLMNRQSDVNYPMWYSEGLAEFMQTTTFTESKVVVGAPTPMYDQVKAIYPKYRPLRIRRMIDLNPRENQTDFYTTAWLMVHFFLLSSIDDPTRMQQTGDFLLRYDRGEDPLEAFELSFGMSDRDMDKLLNDYSDTRLFNTLVFSEMTYDGGYTRRAMANDEVAWLLGDAAIEFGRVGVAYVLFDRFAGEELSPEFAAKIKAAKAVALIHEARLEEGDALMDELLEAHPDDARVSADMAHYAYDRYVLALRNDEDNVALHLDRVVEYAGKALLANPNSVEARYFLGLAQERRGELAKAAETLFGVYADNPAIIEISLALARVLVKQDDTENALYFLSRAYSASHTEDARDSLQEIQLKIQDPEFDIATVDEIL